MEYEVGKRFEEQEALNELLLEKVDLLLKKAGEKPIITTKGEK